MALPNTITLELPTPLARRLEKEHVSESELQVLLIVVLETWLNQRAQENGLGRFRESAVPFARRLVEQNRALFEELAQR